MKPERKKLATNLLRGNLAKANPNPFPHYFGNLVLNGHPTLKPHHDSAGRKRSIRIMPTRVAKDANALAERAKRFIAELPLSNGWLRKRAVAIQLGCFNP
jgi:hypothetical protein